MVLRRQCAGWALLSLCLMLGGTGWLLLQSRPVPAEMLRVQLVNESGQMLIRIDIKHGNSNTEELISALQIKPGERRMLGLNHRPGMGFSLTVHYASGEHFEVCVGKFVEGWSLSEVIRDGYLDEYAGVY